MRMMNKSYKGKERKEISSGDVIRFPLSTEKSIRLMESENKLIFVVDKSANKAQVKKAVEDLFKAKVEKVTTMITNKGEKKAIVRFKPDIPAIDIATKLGMM